MAPAAAPRSLVQAHSDLYGAIARVELLGSDAPLVWQRDDVALTLTRPADYRGEHATAFRITLAE